MYGGESLLVGCAMLLLVAPALVAVLAMVQAARARRQAIELGEEVARLRRDLTALHAWLTSATAGAAHATAPPPTALVAPPTSSAVAWTASHPPHPAAGEAVSATLPSPGETPAPVATETTAAPAADAPPLADAAPSTPQAPPRAAAFEDAATPSTATAPAPASPAPPTPPRVGLEERLGSRLPLWLGGLALALAGIFLVKYSIDQGLLSPPVRIALGALFGIGLLAGSELLARRQRGIATALAGAGVAVLYGVFLAATNLYHLLPPVAGFALMALNTAVAVGLSLRRGQLVAILGLLGGFATPALISTGDPSARNLMAYLLLLELGLLATARRRGWPLLSALALAGGIAWVALFTAVPFRPGDGLWLGLFLLVALAAHAWTLRSASGPMADTVGAASLAERWITAAGAALAMLTFAAVVGRSGFAPTEWGLFALLALGALALARLLPASFALAPVAVATTGVLLAAWGADLTPLDVDRFLLTCLLLVGALTLGAWVAQRGATRPALWCTLAAATAVGGFLLAYAGAREVEGGDARPWAVFALVLAAVAIAAAVPLVRARAGLPQAEERIAAAAVAATTFVSLALPLALSRAWLSVGLALEVPALVWLAGRFELTILLRLAGVLTGVVAARLLANPAILDYPAGSRPIVNWLAYGYGLPLAAFAVALRLVGPLRTAGTTTEGGTGGIGQGDGATLRVAVADPFAASARALAAGLRWACLAAGTALVSLEIRHLFSGGDLDGRSSNAFLESGVLAIAWLAGAAAVLHLGRRSPAAAWRIGGRLLAWGGLAILVLGPGLTANPLFEHAPVGASPVVNLLLAVLGPAILLLALLARHFASDEPARAAAHATATSTSAEGGPSTLSARVFALATLATSLALVTLEVRQAFHGAYLDRGQTTDGEHLAYSVAWIVCGLLLLVGGLRLGRRGARQAGLAVMLLAVLKVFLYDLSALTDLYRVMSFLGLGASLLLLAYLYQRFVFGHREDPP